MVGKRCLPLDLGEVTSSIFPSPGPNYFSWLAHSSILIGTAEGGWGFPFLIMVLFLFLNYEGPCLGFLLFGLTGVLSVAKVETTSYSMFPSEKPICFPYFPIF